MKTIFFLSIRLAGGGAEKTILNLCQYINENNIARAFFVATFHDEYVEKNYRNIIVLTDSVKHNESPIKKILVKERQIRELRKIKREYKVDYCISFLPGADILNVLSRTQEKILSSVRNKESIDNGEKWLRKRMLKYSFEKMDKIVAISKNVKKDLVEEFLVEPQKIQTIYNPMTEISTKEIIRDEFLNKIIENNDKYIITAGRICEQKGQWHLIKAFSLLKKDERYKKVKLIILGEGELKEDLVGLVKKLDISDSVIFRGYVNNVYDYMKNAMCFVFSSLYEGLGNAIVEAMSCGTPVISTDCDCGPRELIAPKTDFTIVAKDIEHSEYGILIPPFEIESDYNNLDICENEKIMMNAMEQMISKEYNEYYRKKSEERAENFRIDNIVNQWMELLLSI